MIGKELNYRDFKKALHAILEEKIETITSDKLMDACDGVGASFNIIIDDIELVVDMKAEYDEETNSLENEQYKIIEVNNI